MTGNSDYSHISSATLACLKFYSDFGVIVYVYESDLWICNELIFARGKDVFWVRVLTQW